MITSMRWFRAVVRWTGYLAALIVLVVAVVLAGFRWDASMRESHKAADVAPIAGRFVNAADVRMFVQEHGAGSAPAVVLIHGTGAWSESWRETASAVAAAGFRVVALDLPPFGFSDRPSNKDYSKPSQARRVLAALDALQIGQAVFVGHSFGGGPTMEAAFLAPDRVRGLVLVDVALDIEPASADDGPWAVEAFLSLSPLRDAVVATFLTNPRYTKRLLEQFIADPAHATADRVSVYQRPLVVTGTTSAVGEWLPVLLLPQPRSMASEAHNYRRLAVPTSIIWGAEDTVTPLPQGERLVGLFPSARLSVMNGVGHIPQIEDPEQFNHLLLSFLKDRQLAANGSQP